MHLKYRFLLLSKKNQYFKCIFNRFSSNSDIITWQQIVYRTAFCFKMNQIALRKIFKHETIIYTVNIYFQVFNRLIENQKCILRKRFSLKIH